MTMNCAYGNPNHMIIFRFIHKEPEFKMRNTIYLLLWLLTCSTVALCWAWNRANICGSDGECELAYNDLFLAVGIQVYMSLTMIVGLIFLLRNEK